MNANELRIGNLIWDCEQKEIDKITGIEECRVSIDGSLFPYTPIDSIVGIELTEEWLLKLGFNNLDIDISYCKDDFSCIEANSGYLFWHKGHSLLIIKYVHQLQNLYFALTGEELTII